MKTPPPGGNAIPGMSKHFPGAPNPEAADAATERLQDAQIAEMIANGIPPDDVMVPVRLQVGAQYRNPGPGGGFGIVASERQYKAMERQAADKLRDSHRNAAAEASAAADRYKLEGAEMDRRIVAMEAERDALAPEDGRRILLDRQLGLMRESRTNMAAAEVGNRQAAKDAGAAAKAVKIVPIWRPTRLVPKSLLDRAEEATRKQAENNGMPPSPFLPSGPNRGSDEYFGIDGK